LMREGYRAEWGCPNEVKQLESRYFSKWCKIISNRTLSSRFR
jgi:hypothetical protein